MAHEDKVNTSSIAWILGSSTVAVVIIVILLAALFYKMNDWEAARKGSAPLDSLITYRAEQTKLLGPDGWRWLDEKKTKVAIPEAIAIERMIVELAKPLPEGARKTVPPVASPGTTPAPASGSGPAGTTPPTQAPAKTPEKH